MTSTQNPMFFYAIAFVIFLALAFKFGRKPLVGWLDAEIEKIRAELDHARRLRAEAEATLADCRAKQAAAQADADAIVAHAKKQVEQMRKQAELDLAASLRRNEQLAAERIHLAEVEAVAEVRAAAVDMAMALARKALAEDMAPEDAAKLADQAIADIAKIKAVKGKAA